MDWNDWWPAIIGAVPGLLSLVWQFYSYSKDKPHLRISSNRQDYPNLIVNESLCPIKYGGPHLSLNLDISNCGNSQFTIRNIEAWYEKDKKWVPLLNKKCRLGGVRVKDEDGDIQNLSFQSFEELKRPLVIQQQGTQQVHFCVSPDCLKSDKTVTLRFYYPQGYHDQDFQLLTPEESLSGIQYTLLGFLPPSS